MTRRFDEKNIVDYLHNFNKNCIRPTRHSTSQHKERKLYLIDNNKFLSEKYPISIEQQEVKKFALIYEYDEKHNYFIVIALKDKYIILLHNIFIIKKEVFNMNKDTMKFHYDYEYDILAFHSQDNYEYEVSYFLTKSIVFDLNKNKFPIGVDILNASEVLNTKKHLIKDIESGEIIIDVTEDKIELRLTLINPVHKKTITLPIKVVGANESYIPSIQTEVSIAST